MELIAEDRRNGTPAALAYGAYLLNGGRLLRCGELFVQRGQEHDIIRLRDLDETQELTVRLPKEFISQRGHARGTRMELEVITHEHI